MNDQPQNPPRIEAFQRRLDELNAGITKLRDDTAYEGGAVGFYVHKASLFLTKCADALSPHNFDEGKFVRLKRAWEELERVQKLSDASHPPAHVERAQLEECQKRFKDLVQDDLPTYGGTRNVKKKIVRKPTAMRRRLRAAEAMRPKPSPEEAVRDFQARRAIAQSELAKFHPEYVLPDITEPVSSMRGNLYNVTWEPSERMGVVAEMLRRFQEGKYEDLAPELIEQFAFQEKGKRIKNSLFKIIPPEYHIFLTRQRVLPEALTVSQETAPDLFIEDDTGKSFPLFRQEELYADKDVLGPRHRHLVSYPLRNFTVPIMEFGRALRKAKTREPDAKIWPYIFPGEEDRERLISGEPNQATGKLETVIRYLLRDMLSADARRILNIVGKPSKPKKREG
ncbi:MAG: hypothetical protein WA021_00455 [Minisyncoccia bacterium]